MEISVIGRGIPLQPAHKEYAEQKASKLERYTEDLQKVEIILSAQGDQKLVEMIATPRKGHPVIGHAQQEELLTAVDVVVDKMYAQLSKMKGKRQDKRRHSGRIPLPPNPSDLVEDEVLETYEDVVTRFSETLDT